MLRSIAAYAAIGRNIQMMYTKMYIKTNVVNTPQMISLKSSIGLFQIGYVAVLDAETAIGIACGWISDYKRAILADHDVTGMQIISKAFKIKFFDEFLEIRNLRQIIPVRAAKPATDSLIKLPQIVFG